MRYLGIVWSFSGVWDPPLNMYLVRDINAHEVLTHFYSPSVRPSRLIHGSRCTYRMRVHRETRLDTSKDAPRLLGRCMMLHNRLE
jgi:hypothetical protein